MGGPKLPDPPSNPCLTANACPTGSCSGTISIAHLKRASFFERSPNVPMPITDEETAIQAIATLDALSTEQKEALHAINTILNNGEPFADVLELFGYYDKLYFRNLLVPRVEVIWSPRLTL